MKYLPTNTLAYFGAAPQFHRYDMSALPTTAFAASTKLFRVNCGQVVPNNEAIEFYCMNHLASVVSTQFTLNEVLPPWAKEVMGVYLDVTVSQGNRMLHYILSICVREMRHLSKSGSSDSWWKEIDTKFGVNFNKFLHDISPNEEAAVKKYMNEPPDVSIGKFIAGLAHAFHKGKWAGGFGGKKWGNVADACSSFIHGQTSMMSLLDTGYTLVHNNAPIFNKGMMYDNQDEHALKILLDVQRSGQVPDLVLDKTNWGVKRTTLVTDMVKVMQNNLPKELKFQGWVNWEQVEKLGALGSYSSEKEKQKKLHPEVVPEKQVVVSKVVEGKKVNVTSTWTVWPGQTVEIFERVAK